MEKCGFSIDFNTGEVRLIERETDDEFECEHEKRHDPIRSIPKDFIAIDFETANLNRCSPCSIGVVIVKNNKIIDCFERLIKPHQDYSQFDSINVQIHGITPQMVKNAPSFDEVMQDILPMLDHSTIVAHNMMFDCSVLCRTLSLYNISRPTCKTLCTCNISRIAFPDLISHKLDIISKYLGIDLDHHNAVSDAQACAQILLNISDQGLQNIIKADYSYGYINSQGNWSPQALKMKKYSQQEKVISDVINKIAKHPAHTTALYDCDFVFTGTLLSMERPIAHAIVEAAGGRASESVNKNTEYLVMGIQDYSKFADGKKSSKTKKAEALRENGCPIEIISEEDFLKMIDF